jgi:predicted O-methyltransferase YrrM
MPTYFDWALRLLRPGGLVIADNTLWGGKVFDDAERDEKTNAVREFNRRMATDPRILSILVPTHDGVAIGVLRP